MVRFMIDTLIIGVGPAGISAAINLRKLNRTVLVIGKGTGQLSSLDVIDNLYGQGPISGQMLIEKGIHQAKQLGIDVITEIVLSIESNLDHFIITTNKNNYQAKTVLLATGKPRVQIDLEGYETFKSKGVHLCATCDGLFYRNKPVAIIGAGVYLEQEIRTLENYTKDITIFTNGHDYNNDTYPTVKDSLCAFIGEKRLTHIKTSKETYPFKGVFLAVNHPKAAELSLKLGVIMTDDNIDVDQNMQTNIKGIFAAGDCIGGRLQVPKALYDGFLAAHGINDSLRGKEK